jgi:methylmalonyl-CoA mutase
MKATGKMGNEEKKRLLSDFPPHTYEAWKEAAIQLLKGRPFERTLITPTYEGFELEPIYTRETLAELPQMEELPGLGSQIRGSRLEGYLEGGWQVSQELSASTPEMFNELALHELDQGQNELNIWPDLASRTGRDPSDGDGSIGVCGLSLATRGDFETLMRGIHPEMVGIYFQGGAAAPTLYALLLAWSREAGVKPADLSGCLGMDPLGWAAETGHFPGQSAKVYAVMADLLRSAAGEMPRMQVIDVRGHPYHNNGASSVQEMAAILATGVCYLREMQDRGLEPAEVVSRMRLSASIGGNFFLEIAKLRALRMLWNRVLDGFEVPESARRTHLHGRTGLWNKTLFDPYVNMLRTTTEAFAAVVGGVDSLHVAPFDEIIRESDAFSRRIARNTHAILAEECGMTQVIDPAGGSWAVESLTDQMAAEAWKRFQEIEENGGMTRALESGSLAKAIGAVRDQRRKNIQRRKDVVLGTNSYPNATEKPLEARKIDYATIREERLEALRNWKAGRDGKALASALEAIPGASGPDRLEKLAAAAVAGATLEELQGALGMGESDLVIEPLRLRRGAEDFEALRFAARDLEESGPTPLVHQLNIGPSRRYRIRADWTSGFFHAAGIRVLSEDDYDTPEEAVAALKESGARFAIITSDDETYASTVETLARSIKEMDNGLSVFVAGAPGDHEAGWRSAGVDDFVHMRVNNYQFNRGLLERMGAEIRTND